MQEPRIKKLYGIWRCMKYRCNSESENNHYAPYYRDRGIRVCEIWDKDFFKFQEWSLENGYKEGLTIDRIDRNGNYEPSNCRWVTMAENSRNKQKNIKIQLEIPIKSKRGEIMENTNAEYKLNKSRARKICEGLMKLPDEQASAFEDAIFGAATMNDIMARFGVRRKPAVAV